MMGGLSSIKPDRIDDAIRVITRVFNRSSRFIEGHSNPHEQQSVFPTVAELQQDWEALQQARANYLRP